MSIIILIPICRDDTKMSFKRTQMKMFSHEYDEDDWEDEGGGKKPNVEASEAVPIQVKGTDH